MGPVLGQLSARGRLTLVGCVALLAVCILGLGRFASSVRYATLPVADPGQQRQIIRVLDRYGIAWRLDATGPRLAVEARRRDEAERILGGQGLGPALRRRGSVAPADGPSAALERDLNRLIATTVGPDRAFASARVTLNRDSVASRSLRYASRGATLARDAQVERFRSGATRGSRTRSTTSWAADRTLTGVRFARGRTERVDVALVVDRAVPAGEARRLRRAIATAAGVRAGSIGLSRLDISRPTVAGAGVSAARSLSPRAQIALRAAPWALLMAGIAVFFGELGRALRSARRLREAGERPTYPPADIEPASGR